jgi:hypothetical protein
VAWLIKNPGDESRDEDGVASHTGSNRSDACESRPVLRVCSWCERVQPRYDRGASAIPTVSLASADELLCTAISHGICDNCYRRMVEEQLES